MRKENEGLSKQIKDLSGQLVQMVDEHRLHDQKLRENIEDLRSDLAFRDQHILDLQLANKQECSEKKAMARDFAIFIDSFCEEWSILQTLFKTHVKDSLGETFSSELLFGIHQQLSKVNTCKNDKLIIWFLNSHDRNKLITYLVEKFRGLKKAVFSLTDSLGQQAASELKAMSDNFGEKTRRLIEKHDSEIKIKNQELENSLNNIQKLLSEQQSAKSTLHELTLQRDDSLKLLDKVSKKLIEEQIETNSLRVVVARMKLEICQVRVNGNFENF